MTQKSTLMSSHSNFRCGTRRGNSGCILTIRRLHLPHRVGYADIYNAGQLLRMLALWLPDYRYQIEVTEPVKDREEVAFDMATHSLWLMVLSYPCSQA